MGEYWVIYWDHSERQWVTTAKFAKQQDATDAADKIFNEKDYVDKKRGVYVVSASSRRYDK